MKERMERCSLGLCFALAFCHVVLPFIKPSRILCGSSIYVVQLLLWLGAEEAGAG